jgi:adenylate cyclase
LRLLVCNKHNKLMEPTATQYTNITGQADNLFAQNCKDAANQLLCIEAQALSQAQHQDNGATEKELAILFLDLRDYTGLLQSHPAKEVIQMVKRLFGVFTQAVSNFKGRVIERAGDSLYAVFGLNTSLQEAANNAYRASKMLFDALAYFNDNYARTRYGRPLEMGIGMHAGEVIVEHYNDDNLSVMGLPVNIAARLQAETKVLNNDLLISEIAYQLLHADHQSAQNETRNISLHGVNQQQPTRLAGKAYESNKRLHDPEDLHYLLAIAG